MRIEVTERPLVTFFVCAYKQEQFIREAVEGALAQTYSPLEIILSDDCSPDRTFEIIREMAATYNGPHRVLLNRNPRNLGIGGHVNVIMDMAAGELIVAAAGDDVSLPERTEALTLEWIASGRPSGICSGMLRIDDKGNTLGGSFPWLADRKERSNAMPNGKWALLFVENPIFNLPGCSSAWARQCWKAFGPFNSDVVTEDTVMTFRASLLNGVRVLERQLVMYRQHGLSIWSPVGPERLSTADEYIKMEGERVSRFKWLCATYRNMLDDFRYPRPDSILDERDKLSIRESISKAYEIALIGSCWWELSLMKRVSGFRYTSGEPGLIRLLKFMPLPAYAHFRSLLAGFKRWWSDNRR